MKFSKKQTLTVEITSWVSLFIIGLSMPSNILEYVWAKEFVNLMSYIFPSVQKIASSSYFSYLSFYYALLYCAMLFYWVFYFFVEEAALFNKEKTAKKIKTKSRVNLRIMAILLAIAMLLGLAYLIFGFGTYSNAPKASLFYSRFGASTFGNIFISMVLTRMLWHSYFVLKYEKELIPEG